VLVVTLLFAFAPPAIEASVSANFLVLVKLVESPLGWLIKNIVKVLKEDVAIVFDNGAIAKGASFPNRFLM
jgi:hypothetical protein